ncbi:MAG: hypothetical protein AAF799_21825 [Myxococcota bacterium]
MWTQPPTKALSTPRAMNPVWRLGLALMLVSATLGCSKPSETKSEKKAASTKDEAEPKQAAGGGGDVVGRTLEESKAIADEQAAEGGEEGSQADAPVVEPPPPGWQRLDLSRVVPTLTGTVDAPPMLELEPTHHEERDADGLQADEAGVRIGPETAGLTLAPLVSPPPRFESADAMAKFYDFDHVENHEFGPEHWVVIHRWDAKECMVHGWSAAAGLKCESLKTPCADVDQWVRVCGSLRAGPTPNNPPTTAASAFPDLDAAVGEVAMTVALAISRNDVAALTSALGPGGLKIEGKAFTATELEAAAKKSSVLAVVSPLFEKRKRSGATFRWHSVPAYGGRVKIWFSTEDGEQPYFQLMQTGTAWHVVEFGVYDLGEL